MDSFSAFAPFSICRRKSKPLDRQSVQLEVLISVHVFFITVNLDHLGRHLNIMRLMRIEVP